MRPPQTVDKKLFSPPKGGRIALSANERIAEFLDFAIQAKFVYANELRRTLKCARLRFNVLRPERRCDPYRQKSEP